MSTAAVFAGQGAQFVGMGKDLAEAFPAVKALYERANGVLGYDIAGLCFDGPAEELTKSNNCQPAIFVTSVACCTALHERLGDALSFDAVAGLSLGEWTALFAAGVVDFETTLKILEARGRFMQEACEETAGGMVSVMGLKPEQLQEVCTRTGVTIANLNSSKQTVLSGTKDGIAAAARMADDTDTAWWDKTQVAGLHCSKNDIQIRHVGTKRVSRKLIELGEIPGVVDAATAQVERHYGHPGSS